MPEWGADVKKHLVAAMLFILAAIVLTYPLVLHLGTHCPALHESPDPLLNTWIINSNLQRLMQGGSLFAGNIFYPHPRSLVFSEHLFGLSLICLPIRAVGTDPITSYNVLFLLSFALSGYAAYLLAYRLMRRFDAAIIAGIIYAFAPFKFAQLNHLQMLSSYWLPLCLLCAHAYMGTGRIRWGVLFFLAWAMQLLSCWYYFFYLCLAIGLAGAMALLNGWKPSKSGVLLGSIGVTLIAILLWLLAGPYIIERGSDPGFIRTLEATDFYAAKPNSYLSTTELNRVWGNVRIGSAPTLTEHQLFPGLGAIVLAMAGAFAAWRRREWRFWFYIGLAAVAGVLSFGPYLHSLGTQLPLPYLLFHNFIPGFQSMRVPSRFAVLVLWGLSVLAARGWGSSDRTRRWWPVAVLLLLAEYFSAPIPLIEAPGEHALPEVYQLLVREAPPGPILELPMPPNEKEETLRDAMYVYYSLFHRRRIVNGISGFVPQSHRRIRAIMQSFPNDQSCRLLGALGVQFVLTHPPLPDFGLTPCDGLRKKWTIPEAGDSCRVYEVAPSRMGDNCW